MPRKAKATECDDGKAPKRGEGRVHEYPQGSGRWHIEIPNPEGGEPIRRRAKDAKSREMAHAPKPKSSRIRY